MKKVVKISVMTAAIVVAMMFSGGCSKDSGPSLVSGKISSKIVIEVSDTEGATSVKAIIGAYIQNNTLHGTKAAEANFSGKKVSITLPDIPDDYLEDIDEFFEDYLEISGKLTYSDKSARIVDIDFLGFKTQSGTDYLVGLFYYATKNDKTKCIHVFVDTDVTVTGGSNIAVKMEKGWNRIYFTDDGKNNKFSTKAPSEDMEWLFIDDLE